MTVTTTSYEPHKITRQLDLSNDPLLEELRRMRSVFLDRLNAKAVHQFNGQDYVYQLAIIYGTTDLVPEIVDPRSAVGRRSGNTRNKYLKTFSDAARCIRCREPHFMEWAGCFILSDEPRVPVFAGLCFKCKRAVVKR